MKHLPVDEIRQKIQFLKGLNLGESAFQDVKDATEVLHRCGFITVTFPKGKIIYRGRPVHIDNLHVHLDEINYPPLSKDEIRFNRATTNKYQVFYGAVPTGEMNAAELIAIMEVGGLESEINHITIGQWIAKEDFTVAALGLHSDMAKSNSQAQTMKEFHESITKDLGDSEKIMSEVSQLISNEFAKEVEKEHPKDYSISAAFGDGIFDRALRYGVMGILFPSKKAEGKAWNVAIHRDAVDHCLEFRAAVVSRSFVIGKDVFVDSIKQSLGVKDGKFNWVDPPPSEVIDEKRLAQIFKNIEEHGGSFFNPNGVQ